MIGKDLTLLTEDGCFNYRVGAVILRDGKLLTVFNGSYYYTVGGRVKFGETADEAILREIREELGAEAEIDYCAYFHEFFYKDREHGGRPTHEVALFYVMKPFEIPQGTFSPKSDGAGEAAERVGGERLVWLPLAELDRREVYPTFFAEYLRRLKREFVVVSERRP